MALPKHPVLPGFVPGQDGNTQATVITSMDENVLPLPALIVAGPEGMVISRWELSDQELDEVMRNGSIWVHQFTFGRPYAPIAVSGNMPQWDTPGVLEPQPIEGDAGLLSAQVRAIIRTYTQAIGAPSDERAKAIQDELQSIVWAGSVGFLHFQKLRALGVPIRQMLAHAWEVLPGQVEGMCETTGALTIVTTIVGEMARQFCAGMEPTVVDPSAPFNEISALPIELKTQNPHFNDVWEGRKGFELRTVQDRDFSVGIWLLLREWSDEFEHPHPRYTGRAILAQITYIWNDFNAVSPGAVQPLEEGWAILNLNMATAKRFKSWPMEAAQPRQEAPAPADPNPRPQAGEMPFWGIVPQPPELSDLWFEEIGWAVVAHNTHNADPEMFRRVLGIIIAAMHIPTLENDFIRSLSELTLLKSWGFLADVSSKYMTSQTFERFFDYLGERFYGGRDLEVSDETQNPEGGPILDASAYAEEIPVSDADPAPDEEDGPATFPPAPDGVPLARWLRLVDLLKTARLAASLPVGADQSMLDVFRKIGAAGTLSIEHRHELANLGLPIHSMLRRGLKLADNQLLSARRLDAQETVNVVIGELEEMYSSDPDPLALPDSMVNQEGLADVAQNGAQPDPQDETDPLLLNAMDEIQDFTQRMEARREGGES